MCGIVGAFLPEPLPAETFRLALERLAHRGPDDEGLITVAGCTLGARRLAVIDLDSGHQPMSSEDGRVAVVQNGEIYNYLELRRELRRRGRRFVTESDTEVLVQAYLEHGDGFVERLRGMFALAVVDRHRRRLVLARDRFGKKPLYYTLPPAGGLLFASEIKALLALLEPLGSRPVIRPQAIYDYLSLGVVPQPHTVYEHVRMLEPGTILCFDGRRAERRLYWSLAFEPKTATSMAAAKRRVRRLVAEAVAIRLRSDVPVGVLLSGGVDSGVVAYEAARLAAVPPRLFTVAVEDPLLDESSLARSTAARLGLETRVLRLAFAPVDELETLVRHYDQPFADPSAIPSMAVSRLASREVKVVLNGDGGDEIFAGYRRHVAARLAAALDRLPAAAGRGLEALLARAASGRRSAAGFALRLVRGLGRPAGSRYLCWTTDLCQEADKAALWRGAGCTPTEAELERRLSGGLEGLDDLLAADLRINLVSDLLVKMDMAAMAFSLEARSPLLDHVLAEYVARLPASFKSRRLTPKYLLREAYADALPRRVVRGPKRGFEVPLERWITADLRELIGDTLAASRPRVTDYLDPAALSAVLAGRSSSQGNWPHLVYSLLVLELWLRQAGAAA